MVDFEEEVRRVSGKDDVEPMELDAYVVGGYQ
jgi:hypothetical protein